MPEQNAGKSFHYAQATAKAQDLVGCHICGKVWDKKHSTCPGCKATIHSRKPLSLQRTAAYLAAAIVLYIPASIYPIMITVGIQGNSAKTILGGVLLFFEEEEYFIAVVIFIASVAIPIAKMFAIAWLCLSSVTARYSLPLRNTLLYRGIEIIGRWSMIDVYVVVILVGLIQFRGLLEITPGIAAISFAGVVIMTILAAMSFDPRLIWDKWEERKDKNV